MIENGKLQTEAKVDRQSQETKREFGYEKSFRWAIKNHPAYNAFSAVKSVEGWKIIHWCGV